MKNEVYNFIFDKLITGELTRNDRLTELYIAENLNISRTPVREALFSLAADGVLEHEPRKGFRLKQLSQQNIEEIYELIGILDGKIAELACDLLVEEDFAYMRFLIESMDSALKNSLYTKYNELQQQFHKHYAVKCTNKKLVEELEKNKRVFLGSDYHIQMKDIQQTLSNTNQEHREILSLFEKREKEKLREYIEKVHWRPSNAKYDIW